jgi:hypothetical protein
MGYRVPKTPHSRGWKLHYEWFDAGVRKTRGIPEEEWGRLGIAPTMTREQVKAVADQLNAQEGLKRIEQRRAGIRERFRAEDLAQAAFFPKAELEEFERERVFRRTNQNSHDKVAVYWRVAKRMLERLRLEPAEYADKATRFYDYFAERGYSPAYIQKLLYLVNTWGAVYCKKRKQFFEKLPAPKHSERTKIVKANRKKAVRQGNRVSEPLSFELLESRASQLTKEQYNWLYVAIAFGLRPGEVDALHGEHPCRIGKLQDGTHVIEVYQSKLESAELSEDFLWKQIPCFLPQQRRALTLIQSGKLEAPSLKILKSRFGAGYTLYCGRNNFIPMMFAAGKPMEQVSLWMGHKTIERTWDYFRKLKRRPILQAS